MTDHFHEGETQTERIVRLALRAGRYRGENERLRADLARLRSHCESCGVDWTDIAKAIGDTIEAAIDEDQP